MKTLKKCEKKYIKARAHVFKVHPVKQAHLDLYFTAVTFSTNSQLEKCVRVRQEHTQAFSIFFALIFFFSPTYTNGWISFPFFIAAKKCGKPYAAIKRIP